MYKFIGIMTACSQELAVLDELVHIQQVRDTSKSSLGELIKGRLLCLRELEIIHKFQTHFEGALGEKVQYLQFLLLIDFFYTSIFSSSGGVQTFKLLLFFPNLDFFPFQNKITTNYIFSFIINGHSGDQCNQYKLCPKTRLLILNKWGFQKLRKTAAAINKEKS